MFRPLTVIAITAFCVVGWNVYRAEDAARQLDRDLRDLHRRIEVARDRSQVLRAEWALLNEPERLRQVSQKHLVLETMVPSQFVRLQDMDRRMPVAIAFAGPVNLFGPAPGSPVALAAAARATNPMAMVAATSATTAITHGATGLGAMGLNALAAQAVPRTVPDAAPRPAPQPMVATIAPRAAPPVLRAVAENSRPESTRAETTRPDTNRPDTNRAEAPRAPTALAANRVEEPRRRMPAPTPRAEAVALREAEPRTPSGGLLRQALHMPISSANAAPLPQAPVPGTGGSIGSGNGSALGFAGRGTLAPPVPVR